MGVPGAHHFHSMEPWSTNNSHGGALEPTVLSILFLSKSPEKYMMEPWSPAILPLGARSPLKYALETRSPRSLRGPHL